MLAMVRILCSGLIGGFMGIALKISCLDSLLWYRREKESCVLCVSWFAIPLDCPRPSC
jgi:hypothetical protein